MTNKHSFANSSSLSHCDYVDGKMHVCFNSGHTYEYECDQSVYEELKKAESPGKHFHQHIKPHYTGSKL